MIATEVNIILIITELSLVQVSLVTSIIMIKLFLISLVWIVVQASACLTTRSHVSLYHYVSESWDDVQFFKPEKCNSDRSNTIS